MKLDALTKLALDGGFLPADKADAFKAAVLAADKKAKDEPPEGNVASSKEIEDKRAKDRKARDEEIQKDRKARDEKRAEDRKARDEKRAEDRKARDTAWEAARDSAEDPEEANDADLEAEDAAEREAEREAEDGDPLAKADPGSAAHGGKPAKPAMDSAEVDRRITAAVAARDELHSALTAVEPILGRGVTFDSAPKAYRAALSKLSVDTKGVHDSALPALYALALDRASARPAAMAMDAPALSELDKLIPGYSRLS